jgi:hypothetical protein
VDPLTEARPEAPHPISQVIPGALLEVAVDMGAAAAMPRAQGSAAALQGVLRNPPTKAKVVEGAVAMGRLELAVQQALQGVVVRAPPVVQVARVVRALAVTERITRRRTG